MLTTNTGPYAGAGAAVSGDLLVVGDGVIGLSIALEAARRGAKVTVLGRAQQGAATWASGGLLARSTGPLPAAAAPFFYASLDAYPEFVARLRAYEPRLELIRGLIEMTDIAGGPAQPGGETGARALDAAELAVLEPALAWSAGMVLHPRDGAVDARLVLGALRAAAERMPGLQLHGKAEAVAVRFSGDSAGVELRDGASLRAGGVVLAAGAWSQQIRGLPRALPVSPLKGQMVALRSCPLRHPVLADHTYLVPRGATTLVGSTSDDTGFDVSTDPDTIARLAGVGREICPALADQPVVESWAGLRPMTPDRLPIIGRDPEQPRLIYACGHSRNGILLTPATAQAVADIATGAAARGDLAPFAIQRFNSGGGKPGSDPTGSDPIGV